MSETSISYPEKGSATALDSNENLLLLNEYYEEIKETADFSLRKYPSPTAKELKNQVGELYELPPEQVVVGNGSDAILDTIVKTFVPREGTLAYFSPSYEMYPFITSRNEKKSLEIPLNPDFSFPSVKDYIDEIDVILITSPNNPTGLTFPEENLHNVLEEDVLVVLDEAYVEYSSQDYISLLDSYDNLILVRTFSKAWGLAGIRVGYALSSAELGLKLLENMLPYNVNSFSLQAAITALKKKDYVDELIDKTIELREDLKAKLEDLGFNTLVSETNFIFCKTPRSIDSSELEEELLERDIRIRTFSDSKLKDYVRITVADEKTNERLISSLEDILSESY